jgi:hypothetical protein
MGEPGVLDLHLPHMANGTYIRPGRARRHSHGRVGGVGGGQGVERRLPQEAPTERELGLPHAIGEQSIIQYCGQNLGCLIGNDAIVTKHFVIRAGFFQTLPVG